MAEREFKPVRWEVDKIVGTPDGSPSPIHCIGYLYFNSMDDLQKAMAAGAETVMADIPNYYGGGTPVVLISEIVG
jgi:uncharacterized protein (TIGR02118 family)